MPAAHLTCVDATRDDVDAVVRNYRDIGVQAYRGVARRSGRRRRRAYVPHPGGYENAADLVAGIMRIGDFEVSVSAYPEKHPDSRHANVDLDMLQAKVDAGATRAITQFFFENDVYFRYLDRVRSRGIDIPIVPGIVPVQNFKQVKNFAERCGTFIPNWLAERFDGLDDDVATRKLVAARCRRRTGARPGRSRRHRFPLLHHEPSRSRLRDLPSARPASGGKGGGVIVSEWLRRLRSAPSLLAGEGRGGGVTRAIIFN